MSTSYRPLEGNSLPRCRSEVKGRIEGFWFLLWNGPAARTLSDSDLGLWLRRCPLHVQGLYSAYRLLSIISDSDMWTTMCQSLQFRQRKNMQHHFCKSLSAIYQLAIRRDSEPDKQITSSNWTEGNLNQMLADPRKLTHFTSVTWCAGWFVTQNHLRSQPCRIFATVDFSRLCDYALLPSVIIII